MAFLCRICCTGKILNLMMLKNSSSCGLPNLGTLLLNSNEQMCFQAMLVEKMLLYISSTQMVQFCCSTMYLQLARSGELFFFEFVLISFVHAGAAACYDASKLGLL